ncbi:MAG TPA: hypothetical protein VE650_02690 [Acetobacteraceae bacterium]|nr:hypothetical protein [Acetobacteraceae bacterium]
MTCKLALAALWIGLGGTAAHATTLRSDTWDSICQAIATVGDDPDPARNYVVLNGMVPRGMITILLRRNQGERVCYRRNVDPHNCASPMQPWVCAPITDRPDDIVDIR